MFALILVERADAPFFNDYLLWARQAESLLKELGAAVHYLDLSHGPHQLLETLEPLVEPQQAFDHPSSYLKALDKLESSSIDLVFNATRSSLASAGCLEQLLELQGLRVLGNPAHAIFSSCDYQHMRQLASSLVKAPTTLRVHQIYSPQKLDEIRQLGPQVLIRANRQWCPFYTALETNSDRDLQTSLDQALQSHQELTVEPLLPGRLFSVAVINQRALSCREFIYQPQKDPSRLRERTLSHAPKDLDSSLQLQMQTYARSLHELVGCHLVSESAFHLSPQGQLSFLSLNASPLSKDPTSFLQLIHDHGLSTRSLLQRLIDSSLSQPVPYPLYPIMPLANLKN